MTLQTDIRGEIVDRVPTPAHAAATATGYIAGWVAPNDVQVKSVHWRPLAAITGADTNTNHLNLDNGGTDGDETTELGNVDFVSGTDATAGEEVELYAPTDPVAYDEGTVFKVEAEKVGNGLGLPAGVLIVRYFND